MSSPRRGEPALIKRALVVGALALPGSALVFGVACRSVVVSDDLIDVADDFCGCVQTFDPDQKIFRGKDDCKASVSARLSDAPDTKTGPWLKKYVERCAADCTSAGDCYYTAPVCALNVCKFDVECCSYDAGVDACQEGYCLPVQP